MQLVSNYINNKVNKLCPFSHFILSKKFLGSFFIMFYLLLLVKKISLLYLKVELTLLLLFRNL